MERLSSDILAEMGGTGFSTTFTPLDPARSAEGAASALYDELYAIIGDNIRRVAKGKAYRQVTEDFLDIAHEDGEGRGDLVSFVFRDGAGLCQASSHACEHWFQLYLAALASKSGGAPSALDTLAARHGLALVDEIAPLQALLDSCAEPLVVLRGHVFGVSGPKEDPYLVSDSLEEGHVEMEELREAERAKVRAASLKQRCDCVVCVTLRKEVDLRLPKPKRPPKAKKPPKLGIETSLYNDGKSRNVSDGKATALPDAVFEPPSLESLGIGAPITTIPDGIARLTALRSLHVINTQMTRIPEVLFRMPWLRELALSQSPFEEASDLAKMPWLEGIRLTHLRKLRALEDLRFDSFPNLRKLKLEWLELAHVPKSVWRAKKLRELEISDGTMTALPASIAGLTELESLTLWLDKLRKVPPLAGLMKLRVLSIQSEALTKIADDALPPGLTELTLSVETCTTLPSVARLRELTKLTLTGAFTALPEGLGELGALKELWIYGKELASIPEGALPKSLEVLSLCDCPQLKKLPTRIGDLAALKHVSATRTGLTELPESMRRLKSLDTMYVQSSPSFTALPPWIGELGALDFLALSDNPALGPLPSSMKRLKKLRHLDLAGSPGAFPLGDWLKTLPLESLYCSDAKVTKDEKARMARLLPNTRLA